MRRWRSSITGLGEQCDGSATGCQVGETCNDACQCLPHPRRQVQPDRDHGGWPEGRGGQHGYRHRVVLPGRRRQAPHQAPGGGRREGAALGRDPGEQAVGVHRQHRERHGVGHRHGELHDGRDGRRGDRAPGARRLPERPVRLRRQRERQRGAGDRHEQQQASSRPSRSAAARARSPSPTTATRDDLDETLYVPNFFARPRAGFVPPSSANLGGSDNAALPGWRQGTAGGRRGHLRRFPRGRGRRGVDRDQRRRQPGDPGTDGRHGLQLRPRRLRQHDAGRRPAHHLRRRRHRRHPGAADGRVPEPPAEHRALRRPRLRAQLRRVARAAAALQPQRAEPGLGVRRQHEQPSSPTRPST